MQEIIQKYSLAIVLGIFGLIGFALIWFSTPWGIGVGYDSIFYLSAADNLLSGQGLSRLDGYGNLIPLTHFPPFYSISIAGLSFIGGFESDIAARILASVFFAFLVGLSGWMIYRYTRSLLACTLGAALVLVSPVLLDVSFMAMSELLFLVLLLLMVHYLNQYLSDGKKPDLVISAVFAALMYLTRYVGLTAVALGGLSILLFRPRSWGKKLKDLIIFGVISLLPVFIFYARNWYLTGSMTNRVIAFHPPSVNQIRQGIATISTWLLPARINPSLRLVVLGLVILTFVILVAFSYLKDENIKNNRTTDKAARQFILLLVLYAVLYLVMVVLSLTFFDASTKLNDRILSPVYLVGIMACLIVVWNFSWFEDHAFMRYGLVALILVFIGMNFLRSFDTLNMMRNEGKGFSGKEWRSSETVAALEQLPPDTLLFSNEAFAIYYLTGMPANWIPENYDPVKNLADENYSERIDLMLHEIVSQDGALVVFNSISKHNVYAPVEELSQGLSVLVKSMDGTIFINP